MIKLGKYLSEGKYENVILLRRRAILNNLLRLMKYTVNDKWISLYENSGDGLVNMTKEDADQVVEYTGSTYEVINDYLMGKSSKTKDVIDSKIAKLDNAFASGNRLERGTILYRGMSIELRNFSEITKGSVMYFRNYVSASLFPIIYGGYANSVLNLDPRAEDIAPTQDLSIANSTSQLTSDFAEVSLGMVISGADQLSVIIPGSRSKYADECEVILPRGIMMKVTKLSGETKRDVSSPKDRQFGTALGYFSVVEPELLDESYDIIDGDKFISEGIVEIIEKSKFSFSQVHLNESITGEDKALELLASIVNQDLPKKFTQ